MDPAECANLDYVVIGSPIQVLGGPSRRLSSCDARGCPNCYAGGKGCNVGLVGETLWLNFGTCNSGGNRVTSPVCKTTGNR